MTISKLSGDKITEKCARAALPVLVRQAQARQSVYYSVLAEEIGLLNNQKTGDVLGIIAGALRELGEQWGERIPPLQGLVVNKQTKRASEGFGYEVPHLADYKNLPPDRQKMITEQVHIEIYEYNKWPDVLAALNLLPAAPAVPPALVDTARGWGGGEGEAHRRLKEYVAAHPAVVGRAGWKVRGLMEYRLPSADAIDVLFQTRWTWLAVEVKAANAGPADILRGLFQCVKYKALLRAEADVLALRPAVDAVLVLEGTLPAELAAARNVLGVAVFEEVRNVPQTSEVF